MLLSPRRQTLIHEFFQVDRIRRRPLSLFDLPATIRKRIYKYACYEHEPELYQSTTFSLKGRADPVTRPYTPSDDFGEFKTAAALLLSCHTIHDEMFKIVYSENDFIVRQDNSGGLDVLYGLKPGNVAAINSLTVTLDLNKSATPSLCHLLTYGHDKCSRCPEACVTKQEVNLQEWHDVLRHIAIHLPREPFCINLVCDLQPLPFETAREIAQKLLVPLDDILTPRLCSVDLGCEPNMALRSLAEEVANKAMRIERPKGHFRLLDLPQELRLSILRYTDLVTDDRQVEWRPGLGYWTPGCGSCIDLERCWRYFRGRGPAKYYQSCRCWLPPRSIFLSCRTLRFEAEQIFFEENRIIVVSSNRLEYKIRSTPPILQISQYLRTIIPTHALRYLRCLEVVFPAFDGGFLLESEPAYRDWQAVLEFVKDKLNCPNLVLRVCFLPWAPCPAWCRPTNIPAPSYDRAEEIFESYRRALSPLSVLRSYGFRHLVLDLASPFWWHLGLSGQQEQDRRWKAYAASVKDEIEKSILGGTCSSASMTQTESRWKLTWMNCVYSDGSEWDKYDPFWSLYRMFYD